MKNIPELLFHVMNSIPELLYLVKVDENGEFLYLYINKAASDVTGLNSTYYNRPIREYLMQTNLDSDFIEDKYREAIRKKESVKYEDIVIVEESQGKKRQINYETTVTPIFNDDGVCTHILAIVSDITEHKEYAKQLKEAKERFEMIWNSTADAMYTFNEFGEILDVNQAFENVFGWSKEEIIHEKSFLLYPDKSEFIKIVQSLTSGKCIESYEVDRYTKKGKVVRILASYSTLFDEDGELEFCVASYKDITERSRMLDEIRSSQEKYRAIAEHSSDLIKVTDVNGFISYVSPSHNEEVESANLLLNKPIYTTIFPEDQHLIKDIIESIRNSKKAASTKYRKVVKSGQLKWYSIIGSPIFDSNGNVIQMVFVSRDITEDMIKEEKLKRLALFDFLTQIPNRAHLVERLKSEIQNYHKTGSNLALLIIDLDGFKKVNDTFGHDVGDLFLQEFTEEIKTVIEHHCMFARLAGDEFAVVIPNVENEDEVIQVAEKILMRSRKEWIGPNSKFYTTASIGIAFLTPNIANNYKNLIKNADIALYRAKNNGKNNYQIYR